MNRLFVDTSAWAAQVNRRDEGHVRVRDFLRGYKGRLVTTNFVFDETITLCNARMNHRAALLIGEALRDPDAVDLVRIEPEDEDAAWELFGARDGRQLSFTDCTSFVLLRRLGIPDVLSLDEDFRTEGFTDVLLPK